MQSSPTTTARCVSSHNTPPPTPVQFLNHLAAPSSTSPQRTRVAVATDKETPARLVRLEDAATIAAHRFIRTGTDRTVPAIVIDVDTTDGLMSLLRPGLPKAAAYMENVYTGHAQAIWLIDTVTVSPEHPRAAFFLQDVTTAMTALAGGDQGFTHYRHRNPFYDVEAAQAHLDSQAAHRGTPNRAKAVDDGYRTVWGDLRVWSLRDLKDTITSRLTDYAATCDRYGWEEDVPTWDDLVARPTFTGRAPTLTRIQDSSTYQAGERNVGLFNETLAAAWTGGKRGADLVAWALDRNEAACSPALPAREVIDMAGRVNRYVTSGSRGQGAGQVSPTQSARCAFHGRNGGRSTSEAKVAASRAHAATGTAANAAKARDRQVTAVGLLATGHTPAEVADMVGWTSVRSVSNAVAAWKSGALTDALREGLALAARAADRAQVVALKAALAAIGALCERAASRLTSLVDAVRRPSSRENEGMEMPQATGGASLRPRAPHTTPAQPLTIGSPLASLAASKPPAPPSHADHAGRTAANRPHRRPIGRPSGWERGWERSTRPQRLRGRPSPTEAPRGATAGPPGPPETCQGAAGS